MFLRDSCWIGGKGRGERETEFEFWIVLEALGLPETLKEWLKGTEKRK